MTLLQKQQNLILIGMPGAGKSTIGVILAKLTSRGFIDTDLLIQTSTGRPLQDIVDRDGYAVLRKIEEEVLLELSVCNCVIATGGSAVYSETGMAHLKSNGIVLFLDADMTTLEARIHDYSTRGLAKRADQSFAEMFSERFTLYTKYSDITITCAGLTHEEVCSRVMASVRRTDHAPSL
ncbi:MAG TPA: shikimate kinase [Desulfuromonadales bacterium]|nr:shikimate kinase [Desulfuromonadales bacterium]